MCLCTYHTVCVCVCVYLSSPCAFLQSHSHRITQYCAKGYSSTKAFSITITSSSLFFPLSVSASISLQHVCWFASLASSVFLSFSVSEISAISADCHIVRVCLLACLLVRGTKTSQFGIYLSFAVTARYVFVTAGKTKTFRK